MLIASCIADLLLDFDEVVLPGFGTIRATAVPATIHPGEHSFHPPEKRIGFDHAPTAPDDSMMRWLEKNGGRSREQADEEVKNFLRQVMASLKDDGAFELPEIGRFYYDVERHLQFSSHLEKNYLKSSYGLPEFISKPVVLPENIPAYKPQPAMQKKKKRPFIWFRF